MRRIVVVAVCTGALCFSAVALGATATYVGSDHDSKCASVTAANACDVELHVRKDNGKVSTVEYVVFKAVPAQCDHGRGFFNNYEPPIVGWDVNRKRKFHGTFKFNFGDAKAHITGRFSKDFKRASGTLRVTGTESFAGRPNCDTGTDDYGVHK